MSVFLSSAMIAAAMSPSAWRWIIRAPLKKLVILDGVPLVEALERCDSRFAQLWWHWFFVGQPEKPERAILADPDAWYGGSPERMGAEADEDFRRATRDPATVHAMVEDYRAGPGIDRRHDEEERLPAAALNVPAYVSGRSGTIWRFSTAMCWPCGAGGPLLFPGSRSTAAIIWPRRRWRS